MLSYQTVQMKMFLKIAWSALTGGLLRQGCIVLFTTDISRFVMKPFSLSLSLCPAIQAMVLCTLHEGKSLLTTEDFVAAGSRLTKDCKAAILQG